MADRRSVEESAGVPELTCTRCSRPVGRTGPCRARPYKFEVDANGVGPVCEDKGSCKRVRLGKRSERRD